MIAPSHRRFSRFFRSFWTLAGLAVILLATATPALADHPSAMKLFPEETLLFIRMANAQEFGQRLRETATGRMIRDPQVQPFVEDVYGRAGEVYAEKVEGVLGISWDELQNLPQGEVAFAIVARPGLKPAFLLMVDQGDQPSAAEKLLERAKDFVAEQGADLSSEKIGDVEVAVMRHPERGDRIFGTFGAFQRENTIVVATDPEVLRNVLWHWDNPDGEADGEVTSVTGDQESDADESNGEESNENVSDDDKEKEFVPTRTLAENTKFSTILRNCRRPQDPPPHAIVFIDPIGLFNEFGRGNPGAQLALGFLPQLGVDGILAAGGTLTFAVGPYDDLSHYHILLENPRSGVLQLITFESGDTTPQPFIPFATENYFTARWNAGVFYDRLQGMIDKLLGDGTFDKHVPGQVTERLGVDLRTAIIDNLAGRVTLFSGYEKPAHFRSQKYIFAAEVVDEAAAAKTLQTVIDKYPDSFEERSFGSVKYHAITPEWWRNMEEAERPFNPFVAVMDGHFFIGGSCTLFEQAVAARDGTIERLADSDDYARIVASMGKETTGQSPAGFMVQRAEESMRHLYELITSETTRTYIEEHAEENPVLAKLAESLKDHQLPPFDTLVKYMGPGGSILYDTDNGYHAIGFSLRNETGQ
jgi:hypothetical protein